MLQSVKLFERWKVVTGLMLTEESLSDKSQFRLRRGSLQHDNSTNVEMSANWVREGGKAIHF